MNLFVSATPKKPPKFSLKNLHFPTFAKSVLKKKKKILKSCKDNTEADNIKSKLEQ